MLPLNAIELIPQKAPFVLVDELVFSEENLARCTFIVPPDHVLVESDVLQEGGLLENMAQTAAAHAGYLASQKSEPIREGFIAAVKDFEVFGLPQVGDQLLTTIRIENQFSGVAVVSGEVWCDERLLASCEMKIFIRQEEA